MRTQVFVLCERQRHRHSIITLISWDHLALFPWTVLQLVVLSFEAETSTVIWMAAQPINTKQQIVD